MENFNLAKKLFDFEEQRSEDSGDSVIYISSDEEEGTSDSWDSDWSTDTESMISRIETEVRSSPILIAVRVMTTEGLDDEMKAGPWGSQSVPLSTPKLGFKDFDKHLCNAPSRKMKKARLELCNTILPVSESHMSPADHERGLSLDTPMPQLVNYNFHASYHIQNVQSYADLSNQRCLSCMVGGKSVDEIKQQKINWYMERSTPRDEPSTLRALDGKRTRMASIPVAYFSCTHIVAGCRL